MNLIDKSTGAEELADAIKLENPFQADKVKEIWMWIRKDTFNPKVITFESWVTFKNGGTEGKQTIKANSFVELAKLTDEFINTLK